MFWSMTRRVDCSHIDVPHAKTLSVPEESYLVPASRPSVAPILPPLAGQIERDEGIRSQLLRAAHKVGMDVRSATAVMRKSLISARTR